MVFATDTPVTEYLHLWSAGDRAALDDLVSLIYTELRALSAKALARERPLHTLQPTDLVGEVYLRLLRLKRVSWEDRRPFLAFAATLMRRVLVEHARTRDAKKRGGEFHRVDVDLTNLGSVAHSVDILDVDHALGLLEKRDPRMVKLIELRFFAGMTEREAAEALEISRATVQRDWLVAKRFLAKELGAKQEEH